MTPGTQPISVKSRLSQNDPVIPFSKPTAKGGRKIARIIDRIDILEQVS